MSHQNKTNTTIRFHVATTPSTALRAGGNDAWSGRLPEPNAARTDGPFATLRRAREAVRKLRDADGKFPGPVAVLVRVGKYFLDETLVLGPEDSGTRECPVTWEAYPGETPILSGGLRVTEWETCGDGLLRAILPNAVGGFFRTRQLFHKGLRLPRARWPKCDPADRVHTGWLFPEKAVAGQEQQSFHFAAGAFPRPWAKPSAGEVNMFVGHGWCNQIVPIDHVDYDRRVIRLARETFFADQAPWYMGEVAIGQESRFFIENMREDAILPGEWCYDASERSVYLVPPADFDPGAVVVPVLDCLIRLRGAEWVTLRGLTFTQTSDGDNYHRSGLLGYGAMFPQAGREYCGEALHLLGASHCAVEGCRFDQVGGNAIYLERQCRRNRICRNEIGFAGANAIVLIGSEPFYPQFNEVADNHIHHAGSILNYVAGVFLGVSDMNRVAHNAIHDMPHHAVNLGTNGLGRNIIEYNEIRRVCLEISDTGAINSWMDVPAPGAGLAIARDAERSGHVIRYNLIADAPGCKVANGRVVADDTTRGIYLDDCTSNCLVYGNIVIRAGFGLQIHGGRHNLVENNLLLDCGMGVHCCDWPPRRPGNERVAGLFAGNCFERNIVVLNAPQAPAYTFAGGQWTEAVLARCDGNVFWEMQGRPIVLATGAGAPAAPCITLADWQELGYDADSVVADPLLVDPLREDFRLHPESPALKLGFVPIPVEKIGIRKE